MLITGISMPEANGNSILDSLSILEYCFRVSMRMPLTLKLILDDLWLSCVTVKGVVVMTPTSFATICSLRSKVTFRGSSAAKGG